MRRPEIASARKRNRARVLKKGPGRRISCYTRRRIAPGTTAHRPEAELSVLQSCASSDPVKSAGREAARCGFGAVRVGALLGRLRLHVQTERFLAVHRGDAVWEAGCVGAALALADVVAAMHEAELEAPLQPQHAQSVSGAPLSEVPVATLTHGAEDALGNSPRNSGQPGQDGWGARKTGTATLALCSAELERSAR